MGSRIEFYRPRGIAGNYRVTIFINKHPTEKSIVFYGFDIKDPSDVIYFDTEYYDDPQTREEGDFRIYEFPDTLVAGNYFVINITDIHVKTIQQIHLYNCTDTGLELAHDHPFIFNPIDLVDLDRRP